MNSIQFGDGEAYFFCWFLCRPEPVLPEELHRAEGVCFSLRVSYHSAWPHLGQCPEGVIHQMGTGRSHLYNSSVLLGADTSKPKAGLMGRKWYR